MESPPCYSAEQTNRARVLLLAKDYMLHGTTQDSCDVGPDFRMEEIMKDFLAKRDKGQLLIQRNRRLKENLLRPMQLSVSEDGYIHYGDKVMLVSPDHPETEADLFLPGDLSLCMTPDEIKAHLSNELEVPCGLSAAQTKIPVGRNTFTILCAAGEVIGQVLRYGQNFRLGITGGFDDRMLYLSSDHRTLLKSSKRSWLQEVFLTHEDSYLNCWQAAFLHPQLRLEYEGSPVPANTKILITHCHTNRGLVAHRHLSLRTYFGQEAEVAAHTYLDSHRVEKPKNHWMLVTGAPRKDLSTMLDLPKPPAEDTRALEQVREQVSDPGARSTPDARGCVPQCTLPM
ncbi:cilia- and flagella-associated protein 161 isoform X1 [Bos indicus x Bos taurus]|uniref:Cilia and flagella associated protein 161 n=2 Tax=Bos indicus x Bos taurus TaxID=30522 RepID=A0A4W2FWQ5_BOBOX|nr:cilia- and flagella-associated protein 161 isoform X1 [Bos indicus x Bos taurus]